MSIDLNLHFELHFLGRSATFYPTCITISIMCSLAYNNFRYVVKRLISVLPNSFMDKKGQVFSLDLIFAIIIFLLIFVSLLVFVYTVSDTYNPYSYLSITLSLEKLNSIGNIEINSLSNSFGTPSNWIGLSCSSITAFGLLKTYYTLSLDKAYSLVTSYPSCFYNSSQVGDSFNLTVSYLNGTPLYVNGSEITLGSKVPVNSRYVISLNRFLDLPKGTMFEVNYKVWS